MFNQNTLSDEISISGKSTQEYDTFNFNFYPKEIFLFPEEEEKTPYDADDNKFLNLMNEEFSKDIHNQEFEESGIKEEYLLGKKHKQENLSFNNFSDINKVTKNEFKNKIFEINKIRKNEQPIYRLDYYKKIFIKNFLDFLVKEGKSLINNCNISEQLQKLSLHKPNYKLYAGNPKEKDNKLFLNKKVKEVFMDYDKNCLKGTGRQKENEKLIKIIYGIIKSPNSEEEENLIDFFEMTIEKGIEIYYDSEDFDLFKNNETNQEYDKRFRKEKNRNFSLFEKNAFIRLVNMPFYSKNPK